MTAGKKEIMKYIGQRTLTVGGRITVQMPSRLTRLALTKKENMMLFVSSEAVESKLIKLETSCIVILPPMVSVLCIDPPNDYALYGQSIVFFNWADTYSEL